MSIDFDKIYERVQLSREDFNIKMRSVGILFKGESFEQVIEDSIQELDKLGISQIQMALEIKKIFSKLTQLKKIKRSSPFHFFEHNSIQFQAMVMGKKHRFVDPFLPDNRVRPNFLKGSNLEYEFIRIDNADKIILKGFANEFISNYCLFRGINDGYPITATELCDYFNIKVDL